MGTEKKKRNKNIQELQDSKESCNICINVTPEKEERAESVFK